MLSKTQITVNKHRYNKHEKSKTKKPLLWLFGDSLVAYGNWRILLPNWNTMSSGSPGEPAGDLLRRLPGKTCEEKPDVIIIMSGTNNLLLFGETSFQTTIEKIVTTLKTNFPLARILLTSLLPYNIAGIREPVSAINQTFMAIALKNDISYFDLFRSFDHSTKNLFESDGVHLNEAGYQVWAQQLATFLQID